MILQFNPDGTTEAVETKASLHYLKAIGEVITQARAVTYSWWNSKILAVIDEDGHHCNVCMEMKKTFIELDAGLRICATCIEYMQEVMVRAKKSAAEC